MSFKKEDIIFQNRSLTIEIYTIIKKNGKYKSKVIFYFIVVSFVLLKQNVNLSYSNN